MSSGKCCDTCVGCERASREINYFLQQQLSGVYFYALSNGGTKDSDFLFRGVIKCSKFSNMIIPSLCPNAEERTNPYVLAYARLYESDNVRIEKGVVPELMAFDNVKGGDCICWRIVRSSLRRSDHM